MPYSETLADRVRQFLTAYDSVEELRMMGGLCFMLNDKMLCGIVEDNLMLRVDPSLVPDLIEQPGCTVMEMGGRSMNGYLLIDETAHHNPKEFQKWLRLALDFNPHAKSSRKRKRS